MKTTVIAEAGVNHNANLEIAYQLVDAALEAGADVVKFQTAIPEYVVTNQGMMANYQIKNMGLKVSQLEMTRKIHLPLEDFDRISQYCIERNILFATTAFDMVSLDYISKIPMPFMKIPSGEITNLPYIRRIGELGMPVLVSTGMSTLEESVYALDILVKAGLEKSKITFMHCTSTYPAPFSDLNLLAMQTMAASLKIGVGYSDHSTGIEVPIAAVALGAAVIEKHITLDKTMIGPDHAASIEPSEFKAMVTSIRNIEQALGSDVKQPSPSEVENILVARRSIVAKSKIKKGEIFTEKNLICKRPATGLSPRLWDDIVGKVAHRDYAADDLIEE